MKVYNYIYFFRILFSVLVVLFLLQSLDLTNEFNDCMGKELTEYEETENSEDEQDKEDTFKFLVIEEASVDFNALFTKNILYFKYQIYNSDFVLEFNFPPEI